MGVSIFLLSTSVLFHFVTLVDIIMTTFQTIGKQIQSFFSENQIIFKNPFFLIGLGESNFWAAEVVKVFNKNAFFSIFRILQF